MSEGKEERVFEPVNDRILAIYGEEDPERRTQLVAELAESEPENPLVKYMVWQEMDEEESAARISMLEEAVAALRPFAENETLSDESDDVHAAFVSMLSDYASHLYFYGEKDRALEVASEFMKYDRDGYIVGRLVYYALLIEKGQFDRAVEAADEDVCETPIAAYCRAIALYERDGANEDASDALLEAISLDPDMVFYILGFWTFDEEQEEAADANDEEAAYLEDLMMHVSVLSELWAATEERLAFLGVVAFAFGYMTGRMEDAGDMEMLEEGYKTLGCLEEMQEARDTLHAAIASGKEQEDIDEEALMLFREIRDKGFFS